MCQAIVEMFCSLTDGLNSAFINLGVVYGVSFVGQPLLCVGLVVIAPQMLGEALVRQRRGVFVRPSPTPGNA